MRESSDKQSNGGSLDNSNESESLESSLSLSGFDHSSLGVCLPPPPFPFSDSNTEACFPIQRKSNKVEEKRSHPKGENKQDEKDEIPVDWSTPKKVMVIGSPSPAELANHPYQFIDAAKYQGVDENTIWIIERTGYELGKVPIDYIESAIGPGRIIWVTPKTNLISNLNRIPDKSIDEFRVFSHGLAGKLTLRYGWSDNGNFNYGLTVSQVSKLKGQKFTQNAKIEFHSCNTGSDSEYGNLAEEFAQVTGKEVKAWTGRTSYSEINDGDSDGDTGVHASQKDRGGSKWTGGYDLNEVYSQNILGRVPKLTTFSPGSGFDSTIAISVRLPASRTFYVSSKGSVSVSFPFPGFRMPNRKVRDSDALRVVLWKDLDYSFDSNKGEKIVYPSKNGKAKFSGLSAGKYYLEIINKNAPVNYGEQFISDIRVRIN